MTVKVLSTTCEQMIALENARAHLFPINVTLIAASAGREPYIVLADRVGGAHPCHVEVTDDAEGYANGELVAARATVTHNGSYCLQLYNMRCVGN